MKVRGVLLVTLFCLLAFQPIVSVSSEGNFGFPALKVGSWYYYGEFGNSSALKQLYASRLTNITVLDVNGSIVKLLVNDTVLSGNSTIGSTVYSTLCNLSKPWFSVFFNITDFNSSLEYFISVKFPKPLGDNIKQSLNISYGTYDFKGKNMSVVIVENLYTRNWTISNNSYYVDYIYEKWVISIDYGLVLERTEIFPISYSYNHGIKTISKGLSIMKLISTNSNLVGNNTSSDDETLYVLLVFIVVVASIMLLAPATRRFLK